MLTVLDNLPSGLLERRAADLHQVLPEPTLIHLGGRRPQPLFVSVLLHGNEDTGWEAVRTLLRQYQGRDLPRALSLFVGNVVAARDRQRFLPGQPDYNRIWAETAATSGLPERAMVQEVQAQMRKRGVFASVDIHNNTGINPHYACVRRLDHRYLHLATLFSRTVVYFTRPEGVQTQAFSPLCPSVTVECGQAGEAQGVEHALEYVDACLHLSDIPNYPPAPHDIDLFHTVAIVKVPPEVSIGVGEIDADLRLLEDIDHLNFRELPASTTLGWARAAHNPVLDVRDAHGREVFYRFFSVRDGEVRTVVPIMPSMLTVNIQAIRQDCLCYLMERHEGFYQSATSSAARESSV